MKTKPTKKDLIALINWAAHHAGSAKVIHDNDRDPNGFERAQTRLDTVANLLREAAGYFPMPDESKWTPRLCEYGNILRLRPGKEEV